MTWRHGLFVHWPFDPDRIRPHVPAPLELDTYDDRAWVSLLPFVLSDAGPRYAPSVARLTFPELNFRTYVRFDGVRGLYFFSIDVGNRLVSSIVGRTTRLPCYYADVDLGRRDDQVEFRSRRKRDGEPPARFEATYRPDGPAFRAEPGTLDYWLAERRRLFDSAGDDVLYAEIAHEPWRLQPVDVNIGHNTMFEASGLPTPEREPRVRYSERRSMTGSVPRWIRGLEGDSGVLPDRLARR